MGCSDSAPLDQQQRHKALQIQQFPITELPSQQAEDTIHDVLPAYDPTSDVNERVKQLENENKLKDEQLSILSEKLQKYQASISALIKGTQQINFEEINQGIHERNKQIDMFKKREAKMKTVLKQRDSIIEKMTKQLYRQQMTQKPNPMADKAASKIQLILRSILKGSYDSIASFGVAVPKSLLIFNKNDSPRLQKAYMKAVEEGTDLTLLSYPQAIYHLNRILITKCQYDLSSKWIEKDLDTFFLYYVAKQTQGSKVLGNKLLVQLLLTLKSMDNQRYEYPKMIAKMLNIFHNQPPMNFRLKTYLIKISVSLEKVIEKCKTNSEPSPAYTQGGVLDTDSAYKYLSEISHGSHECFQYFYDEFQDMEEISKVQFMSTFVDYFSYSQNQAAAELQRLYENTCTLHEIEQLTYEHVDTIMKKIEIPETAANQTRYNTIWEDIKKITENSGKIKVEHFTGIMLNWSVGNTG